MKINGVVNSVYFLGKRNEIKNSGLLPKANFATNPMQQGLSSDIFMKSIKDIDPIDEEALKLDPKEEIYQDSEKFASYFHDRLKRELSVKSEEDIEGIIKSVQEKTGESEETVRRVVSRLSSFSSYSQIIKMGDKLRDYKIASLYDPYSFNYYNDGFGICLADAVIYTGVRKSQLSEFGSKSFYLESLPEGKTAFLIDDYALYWLNNLNKKGDNNSEKTVFEKIKSGRVKLFAVDGWNVKSDGKYYSFGMFGKNIELDELAQKVIEKMQNENLTIDEALNGDFIKDTKKILGDSVEVYVVKDSSVEDFSQKQITEMLSPVMPSEKTLKNALEVAREVKTQNFSEEKRKDTDVLVRKYLDTMFCGESSDSLTRELKEIHQKIKEEVEARGGKMEDVIYLRPCSEKSFDLINYQYQKTNNIDPKQFARLYAINGEPAHIDDLDNHNRFFVILDDMTGSGGSLIAEAFEYETFLELYAKDGAKVIFAPIISLAEGVQNIQEEIIDLNRQDDDLFVTNHILNYPEFSSHLNEAQKNLLGKVLGSEGHSMGGSAIIMPYGTPDNNSDFGSVMSAYFLSNVKPGFESISDNNKDFMTDVITRVKEKEKGDD